MAFDPYAARTREDMRDVLMAPEAPGPATLYYMIRGGSTGRNVTVLAPGTVGAEYVKTYGHYHVGALDETYRFLEGEGVVLMQKRADGRDPSTLAEFSAKRVRAGDEVYIPAGYGHLVANIGATWLVMTDNAPVAGPDDRASFPGHADYAPVRQMHGFAYYLVAQDGAPAFVRNAAYARAGLVDLGGIPEISGA